jgi:hypothetical protein
MDALWHAEVQPGNDGTQAGLRTRRPGPRGDGPAKGRDGRGRGVGDREGLRRGTASRIHRSAADPVSRGVSPAGSYLRMLLTHGARSFLWHAKAAKTPTSLQRWAIQTEQRRGHNVAAVAVANKLARIVWAVWTHQRPFEVDRQVA